MPEQRKDTGGPAFANLHIRDGVDGTRSIDLTSQMTLRDYFAAKAMAACITVLGNGTVLPVVIPDARLSERAYQIADAMLKERSK